MKTVPGIVPTQDKALDKANLEALNSKDVWQGIIWEGTLDELEISGAGADKEVIERIWWKFQQEEGEIPRFHNRSMSVGDVISLDGRFYQCGTIGWHELENFKL